MPLKFILVLTCKEKNLDVCNIVRLNNITSLIRMARSYGVEPLIFPGRFVKNKHNKHAGLLFLFNKNATTKIVVKRKKNADMQVN